MPKKSELRDHDLAVGHFSVESMPLNRKSLRVLNYAAALVLVAIASLFANLLWPLIDRGASALFLAAIMVTAFYGGFGPGLFATVLSVLIIDYFFVPPFYRIEPTLSNAVRAGVFTSVSMLISWLNGSRRRLMDRIRARDREREALLKQISGFNDELSKEVLAATAELSTANTTLLQAQQRLIRSERLAVVGQMAASLAHEIGTPLNAISGHLKLLARNHPADDDTRRRVEIINKQLEYIVGIVRSLLEKTHQRQFALQPTDLNGFIREMLWLIKPMLDRHGIEANVRLDNELPRVEADRDSLQQVFLNLTNNSIEAMPAGGRIEIFTRRDASNGLVEIIFRDTGTGIDPQIADRLFEPMCTTKASGSGFGLAITQEILGAHGGQIEAIEDAAAGAAFRLTFPLPLKADSLHPTENVTTHAA